MYIGKNVHWETQIGKTVLQSFLKMSRSSTNRSHKFFFWKNNFLPKFLKNWWRSFLDIQIFGHSNSNFQNNLWISVDYFFIPPNNIR